MKWIFQPIGVTSGQPISIKGNQEYLLCYHFSELMYVADKLVRKSAIFQIADKTHALVIYYDT